MIRIARRILLVLTIAAPAAGIGYWWVQHKASQGGTYTVELGDMLEGVTVSGTVRCKDKTAVAAEVVARVRRLGVAEGQEVSEGDVLLELDDGVLAADCEKARAALEVARQCLAERRAGPRKQELIKARQAVKQADPRYSYARKENKKIGDLFARGASTQAELDLAESRLNVAEAELKAAEAHVNLLLAGTRPEQVAQADAEVALAKAELQRCLVLQAKHVLRAPHAGTVTARYVNVGEVVSPGQVLLRLDNTKVVEIRAHAQESQLSGIKPGCQARVLADAYPDSPQHAGVERILPRVDPESGTVTVLLKLGKSPTIALMDGMAVDVAFIRQERKAVVRVPAQTVAGSGQQASVYVKHGNSFVKRRISTGLSDGHWVEVKTGLKLGDVVRVQ